MTDDNLFFQCNLVWQTPPQAVLGILFTHSDTLVLAVIVTHTVIPMMSYASIPTASIQKNILEKSPEHELPMQGRSKRAQLNFEFIGSY